MIKFLHTRIRVSDLDQTADFYKKLGFVESRRFNSPQGNKLIYLDIPGASHSLELCWSPDYTVSVPEDLMHTCVGVDNIMLYCTDLEAKGIEIWPENWRETFSSPNGLKMAFVTDPDGYEVEILEN